MTLDGRVRVFGRQGCRHPHVSEACCEILPVQLVDSVQLHAQSLDETGRQGNRPILAALALADGDLIAVEVEILDPQAAALEHAHPGAVGQLDHEGHRVAGQCFDDATNLVAAQDDGQTPRSLRPNCVQWRQFAIEDLLGEKQDRGEGLILCACRHVSLDGEVGEESLDVGSAECGRVFQAVEPDEAAKPANVGLFGSLRIAE